jgi:hypothetical protein
MYLDHSGYMDSATRQADLKAYLHSARSRSLTPADLVRINSRETKALKKRSDAGLYSFNRKEVSHVVR